jgi:hypothetical protein
MCNINHVALRNDNSCIEFNLIDDLKHEHNIHLTSTSCNALLSYLLDNMGEN